MASISQQTLGQQATANDVSLQYMTTAAAKHLAGCQTQNDSIVVGQSVARL